jgi:hypothetical protein
MGTEMVPETLVSFDHLTWLMAQEDFIKFKQMFSTVVYEAYDKSKSYKMCDLCE